MQAIETMGIIDKHHKLLLDEDLPIEGPSRVKVIILVTDNNNHDITDKVWLKAMAHNPTFSDLNDPIEDIYTIQDGKPFHD